MVEEGFGYLAIATTAFTDVIQNAIAFSLHELVRNERAFYFELKVSLYMGLKPKWLQFLSKSRY
jgi:hypothetical protein